MSTATDQVWTLGSLLDWTAKHLAQKQIDTARLDAEVLLAHVVGCKRIDLYGLRYAEEASPEIKQQFRELIRRRLEGCPVAYLVGRKEFYGLELKVTPAVLIPRPDSELVVMECLTLAKSAGSPRPLVGQAARLLESVASEPLAPRSAAGLGVRGLRVIDIGTGSGNLAIAIAKQHATADVTAIDTSAEALKIAQENAAQHGVAERVRFLEGDLFAPLAADETFDFIVSNPPYIADEDIPKLPIGVRQYEPLAALQGGPGGFVVFDRLIAEARTRLKSGGYLIVEIGTAQERPARDKLSAIAEFQLAPTIYDYSGHPRVLRVQRIP